MKLKYYLLSVLLLPFSAFAGDIVFSYDTGEHQQFCFGTQKREVYDLAIRLHANELAGATIKEIRVPVNAAVEKFQNCKAWLASALNDNHDLYEQDVTPDAQNGMITITLAQPVTIGSKDVYVGFTFGLSATNSYTKMPVIAVQGDETPQRCYIKCSAVNGRWADLGPDGPFDLAMQVLLGNVADNRAWISNVERVDQLKGTPVTTTIDLRNTGAAGLNSVELEYTLDGKSGTTSINLEQPLPSRYNALARVPVTLPEIAERGSYSLTLQVVSANGETLTDVAEATGEVNTYDRLATRRVLMEEFTAMSCGYCPRGIAGIDYLAQKYPDTFIPICYHIGDALQGTGHLPYPSESQPSCLLDRSWIVDPYFGSTDNVPLAVEDDYLYAQKRFTYADINVKAAYTDADCSKIEIDATANFIKDCPDQQFRVDYFVVADSLTDESYYQENYYSNDQKYAGMEGLQEYIDGKRVLNPFTFNDVILSWSDDDPSRNPFVPMFAVNQDVNMQYEMATPAKVQDKDKVRVVAALIEHATGNILNAAVCKVTGCTAAISTVKTEKAGFQKFYNLQGRMVGTSTNGLPHGIYVKVEGNKSTKIAL